VHRKCRKGVIPRERELLSELSVKDAQIGRLHRAKPAANDAARRSLSRLVRPAVLSRLYPILIGAILTPMFASVSRFRHTGNHERRSRLGYVPDYYAHYRYRRGRVIETNGQTKSSSAKQRFVNNNSTVIIAGNEKEIMIGLTALVL